MTMRLFVVISLVMSNCLQAGGETEEVKTLLSTKACAACNLTDAYLANSDLSGANLMKANLTNANLANTNLIGANLTGATLDGANLSNANLTGARLNNSSLKNANLRNAFIIADIKGERTDFSGADLTGAIIGLQWNLLKDEKGDRSKGAKLDDVQRFWMQAPCAKGSIGICK